ncbi:MAG TPA: hypothetical protein VFJ13_09045, partial [Paracoccaceae bacterium]|nr:hypothetical protein [Paracoccaceae bacterium]
MEFLQPLMSHVEGKAGSARGRCSARNLIAGAPHTLRIAGRRRILIVDLNNFASFPTLAIGLLTAALRNAGHQVDVLCPLAFDVPATQRERRETLLDHLSRRVNLTDWQPA